MSGEFDYIRAFYGVPAKKGLRVTVNGKPGKIISARSARVVVRLDGEKHGRPYHPTDPGLVYGETPGKPPENIF